MAVPTVRVELARVINLGDYNTLKIDFAVEDSARVKPDGETEKIEELFTRVFNYVEKKLDEKVELVEG